MAARLKTEPLLKLIFEIDPHDLIETQYRIKRAPTQVKERWKNIFMSSGVAFFIPFFTSYGLPLSTRFLLCLVVAAVFFIVQAVANFFFNKGKHLRKKIGKTLSKRHPGGSGTADLVGKRELTIYEDGVSLLTDFDFTATTWEEMKAICLLSDSILFCLRPTKFLELPSAKLDEKIFHEAEKILRQNAPPDLIRTKFDYPL